MIHRGYCGIDCAQCPSYQAYLNVDNELRKELAKEYSTSEKPLNPEQFNCAGCKSTNGIIFDYCNECEIRICAQSRELEDCSYCSELPCAEIDKMVEFMGTDKPLQALLDLKIDRNKNR